MAFKSQKMRRITNVKPLTLKLYYIQFDNIFNFEINNIREITNVKSLKLYYIQFDNIFNFKINNIREITNVKSLKLY